MQSRFKLKENANDTVQFVVRKWTFDVALFVLLKHMQQHLHSDLYISLLPNYFRTDLIGYQNLIIFIDQFGFIRVYSAAGLNCTRIDYNFLIENTSDSKFLVPAIKGMNILSLKLNLYNHIRYRCCGLTYLMQLLDENFYCRNPR